MKLKQSFIREVIEQEKKLTKEYLYWTEKYSSSTTQETFVVVYRSKTDHVYCRGSKLIFDSYETVGVYNETGERY